MGIVFSTEIGVTFDEGSPFYRFVKANRKVRATKGIALPNWKGSFTATESVTETKPPVQMGKGEKVG